MNSKLKKLFSNEFLTYLKIEGDLKREYVQTEKNPIVIAEIILYVN